MLRHNIQLVLVQLRQQVLGQDQAVNGGIVKGDAISLTPLRKKAHVELGVVCSQRPITGKLQKGTKCLLLGWGSYQHFIRDSGQIDNVGRQDTAW